ncbi:MAG: PAS domain-containing protein [Desulfobacteraceae bacterium]|nr:PAS domain-containing protein [Desulfobacteraceae bacterium]
MRDADKTKEQLICELEELRREGVPQRPLSEADLRAVFATNVVPVFYCREDGRIIEANDAFLRLTGFSRKELESGAARWDAITPPEWRHVDAMTLEYLREYGISPPAEKEYLLRDGRRVSVLVGTSVVSGQSGHILGILVDMTEKKRIEQELREKEELFRLATESVGGVIYEADLRTGRVSRSTGMLALLGYNPGEGLDMEWWWQQIHPEDARRVRNVRHAAYAAVAPALTVEYRIMHRAGQWLWVMDNLRIIYDVDGKPVRLVGCAVSIDERKKAEQALRDSEALWQFALEGSGDGVWDWNPQTSEVFFSKQWKAMLGYAEDEIGHTLPEWDRHLHPDDRDRVYEEIGKYFAGNTSIYNSEHRLLCKDGSYKWVLARGKVVTWTSDGRPLRAIGTNIDITYLKQVEKELREAREELARRVEKRTAELQKANQELHKLSSMLIFAQEEERKRIGAELHDSIGQTLAGVKLMIEKILLASDRGNCEEAFNELRPVVPLIQHSMRELRTIYTGLRPTMLDNLGLIATLQWLCRQFQVLYPKYKVNFETTVEERDIPEELKVVIFRISQEALNNSTKHSQASTIDVCLMKGPDGIQIIVADDGEGFNQDKVPQFAGREGFGLTGMKERAEIMGGTFSIISTEGAGTIVRASWPVSIGL